MFELEATDPVRVGWLNQFPDAGLYVGANTSSNVYCTVYVIVPVTVTAIPIFAGEIYKSRG
jgi:hypothetical protein